MTLSEKQLDRFFERIYDTHDCWLRSGTNKAGYSYIRIGGKKKRAHRVSYELFIGPIPEGTELDHLCRVHNCVNPTHLEPVTHGENVYRGDHWQRRKTQCPQGHDYVIVSGKRVCRLCRARNTRRYRERRKL